MMTKQTPHRVIQAFASLEGNTDFEAVREYLNDCLKQLRTDGIFLKDDVQCRWNQGAQQFLVELLEKMSNARAVIRKS